MAASLLHALLPLALALATTNADLWCHREELQPFPSALDHVGEMGALSAEGLQTIINEAFYRVSCDAQDLGEFNCTNVSKI